VDKRIAGVNAVFFEMCLRTKQLHGQFRGKESWKRFRKNQVTDSAGGVECAGNQKLFATMAPWRGDTLWSGRLSKKVRGFMEVNEVMSEDSKEKGLKGQDG